jgi:hypothetical protein
MAVGSGEVMEGMEAAATATGATEGIDGMTGSTEGSAVREPRDAGNGMGGGARE